MPRNTARERWTAVAMLAVLLTWVGCGASSKADPRCRISAESPHRGTIAKSVNGSDLWREYFKRVSPKGKTPLVEFTFTVERTTRKSYGGDYDPGTIAVEFKAQNLNDGRLLFDKDVRVNLDEFMVGFFDKNATREQIQEIAFKATEDRVYPYLDRWVQIAAIRAMGNRGSRGTVFKKTLNDLIGDKWTSGDMRGAAEEALRSIDGRA